MAAKNKIKKDKIGLYTICGGYISRPIFGTKFQEGDEVNTHHFGGSTKAGVTSQGKPLTHNFKKGGQYEMWTTTGMDSTSYRLKKYKTGFENLFGNSYSNFDEYLELQTKWYAKQYSFEYEVYNKLNSNFVK